MQADEERVSVVADAVRSFSLAGRIIDYVFYAVFLLGLLVIGIAFFRSEGGSIADRLWVAFRNVALFGAGFGLLFLSRYLLRRLLSFFLYAGVSALEQSGSSAGTDRGAGKNDPPPTGR